MKIFQKQNKSMRGSGSCFFGDEGEIPIGVSYSEISKENISSHKGDRLHYHKNGYEFYFVVSGEATLEVDGKDVVMEKDKLIMIEPSEKHYVKKISELPFNLLTINTVKDKNDKIAIT